MKVKQKISIILIVLISLISLCSCGPSLEYRLNADSGKYPTEEDLPFTKWVCNEYDMFFYIYGLGEGLIGECTINGKVYRVDGFLRHDTFSFDIYNMSRSSPFIYYPETEGTYFINTFYEYSNDMITCYVSATDLPGIKAEDDILTFTNAGKIAQKTNERWRCEQIDMYLDSFSDVEDYFKGEIVIDGEKKIVQAYELGNGDNYYYFTIENEYGGTDPMLYALLRNEDGKITFEYRDAENMPAPETYTGVNKDNKITFVKESV